MINMDKIIPLFYASITLYFGIKIYKPNRFISSNTAFYIYMTMTLLFATYALTKY